MLEKLEQSEDSPLVYIGWLIISLIFIGFLQYLNPLEEILFIVIIFGIIFCFLYLLFFYVYRKNKGERS